MDNRRLISPFNFPMVELWRFMVEWWRFMVQSSIFLALIVPSIQSSEATRGEKKAAGEIMNRNTSNTRRLLFKLHRVAAFIIIFLSTASLIVLDFNIPRFKRTQPTSTKGENFFTAYVFVVYYLFWSLHAFVPFSRHDLDGLIVFKKILWTSLRGTTLLIPAIVMVLSFVPDSIYTSCVRHINVSPCFVGSILIFAAMLLLQLTALILGIYKFIAGYSRPRHDHSIQSLA